MAKKRIGRGLSGMVQMRVTPGPQNQAQRTQSVSPIGLVVNGLHCAASHTHDFSQVSPSHVPTFVPCPKCSSAVSLTRRSLRPKQNSRPTLINAFVSRVPQSRPARRHLTVVTVRCRHLTVVTVRRRRHLTAVTVPCLEVGFEYCPRAAICFASDGLFQSCSA